MGIGARESAGKAVGHMWEIALTLFIEFVGLGMQIAFPEIPREIGFLIMGLGVVPLVWLLVKHKIPKVTFWWSLINLNDAATIAYEKTRGTRIAEIAEAMDTGNILGYYAYALFDKTLFGKRPPSRKLEAIPRDERKRCSFANNYSALKRTGSDQILYDDLQIRKVDIASRVAELKVAAGEPNNPMPWHLAQAGIVMAAFVLGTTGVWFVYDVPPASALLCKGVISIIDEGQVRPARFPDHWMYSRAIRLAGFDESLIGVRFEARSKPGADLRAFYVERPDGSASRLDAYGQLLPEGIYYFVHEPTELLKLVVVAHKPELVEITEQFRCEPGGPR